MFFHKWTERDENVYLLPLTTSGPGAEYVGAQVVDGPEGPEIQLDHLCEEVTDIYRGQDERDAAEKLKEFLRGYFREGTVVKFTKDDSPVQAGATGLVTGWSDSSMYVELDNPPEGLARGEVAVHIHALNLRDGMELGLIRLADADTVSAEGEAAERAALVNAALARTADQRAALKQDSPEAAGFQWDEQEGNWIKDTGHGRVRIEPAKGSTWTEPPMLHDVPARVTFWLKDDPPDEDTSIFIGAMSFPSVQDAVQCWEE